MKGELYGVGVGPGDPELMTLKAVRIINQCRYIAVPYSKSGRQVALDICKDYLKDKVIIHVTTPMTYDSMEKELNYCEETKKLFDILDKGHDVVFVTLGDPTVYSTYTYIEKIAKKSDYKTHWVAGVTSFCAAAAALGIPLCEKDQPLTIIPGSYRDVDDHNMFSGGVVFMKSGKKTKELVDDLNTHKKNIDCVLVENVGMNNERITKDLGRLPEDIGYFSMLIYKEKMQWFIL